ncbi:hypothetical protein HMPREF0063_11449 [Aeromicrobium marinum DSM 15272]|uniref:Uncharacterized protein n=1 Tax=Aeromicrobium marinum DSM 15272 TaxID=585531 RepID=E2SBP0_9ACTN|nr:hypothetical protein [Aeromicrobium marinum]EFQ83786.1 hypothetical protein HMPREF0063_11449 [Aeromicrobium marinum DSM 15272]
MRARALTLVAALVLGALAIPSPAAAAARVGISNDVGSAAIDPTYATTLRLSGTGFQSIQGGHGGVYVFFGVVRGTWQPSQGGRTGENYFYVPDSEAADNQGFQRFIAFPGGDTAGAANGGTVAADGTWSASVVVPGAVFEAADRNGSTTTVDCRTETCGIITVGAHGVTNATNETFTPVSVADLYGGEPPASAEVVTPAAPAAGPEAAAPAATGGLPTLVVDRTAAVPGRILTFTATGLVPGDLVVATLDDGLAAAGPIAVGLNGQVAGAIELPVDLAPGTHVLKLSGEGAPTVTFAVRALDAADDVPWIPIAAASVAAVLLLLALLFATLRIRSARRKAGA